MAQSSRSTTPGTPWFVSCFCTPLPSERISSSSACPTQTKLQPPSGLSSSFRSTRPSSPDLNQATTHHNHPHGMAFFLGRKLRMCVEYTNYELVTNISIFTNISNSYICTIHNSRPSATLPIQNRHRNLQNRGKRDPKQIRNIHQSHPLSSRINGHQGPN